MEFSRWNLQYLFSEYASKLEEYVKQRYLQKISSIGVDPALIEGKLTLRTRQPDCLSPVESIDLLFYLVLETSFYAQQQFKENFDKFVVLAKVRHYSIV